MDITVDVLSAISFDTLRNIAQFIGVISKGDALELLEEIGVSKERINEKETTSKMIYHVLKQLQVSNPETLWKLIKISLNPALYDRTDITDRSIVALFNEWLSFDGLLLTGSLGDGFAIKKITSVEPEPQVKEGEVDKEYEDALKAALKGVVGYIAEIKVAYSFIIRIVGMFYRKRLTREEQLMINDFYIELSNLVRQNIDFVHRYLTKTNLTPTTKILKGGFIPPFIYKDSEGIDFFYKPFSTLYLALLEMENTGRDWTYVNKRMDKCYGVLEDRCSRFGAAEITEYPHKDFIEKVTKALDMITATNPNNELRHSLLKRYIESDEFKARTTRELQELTQNRIDKGLTFYLKSGKLYYVTESDKKYKGKIRPGSNGYLILKYLMTQPKGAIQDYKTLATQLNQKHTNIDSDDERRVRDAVQSIRKTLKIDVNDDPFLTQYGFGLDCPSHIERE